MSSVPGKTGQDLHHMDHVDPLLAIGMIERALAAFVERSRHHAPFFLDDDHRQCVTKRAIAVVS